MLKEKKSVLRVPVFEQRVDNIVGIAYAMDLLDYVQKVGQFLLFLWLWFSIASSLIVCRNLIVRRIIICLILKGELLETTTVGDMAHKPAYFVPGNL
jgi:CBS domain containing-hemolysin-like protein